MTSNPPRQLRDLSGLNDVALARSIALEAANTLTAIRRSTSSNAIAVGQRGDGEANALILERLRAARPDDFILSEESHDDRLRCAARRVWIIDPLDGTNEFTQGHCDWAVHIGLAVDGVARVGAVALPATGQIFATDDPAPAFPPLPPLLRMVVSRSRAQDLAARVATDLGTDVLRMGSAGVKAMAVVSGKADIYLHDGGQYEWDNCAPAAVAMAAGLHVSRIDGTPLVYNCAEPLLPDLLICRKELAETVLAAIARSRPEPGPSRLS